MDFSPFVSALSRRSLSCHSRTSTDMTISFCSESDPPLRSPENLTQPPDRPKHPFLPESRPFHTQKEMIDAEGFVPAGDFFLHRNLIADDETVPGHFRETHVGGRAFHAPGGIGVVLVFQCRAAFLHRRGVAGADIAF